MSEFTFREIDNITLRATYPFQIGNRQIEKNEPIAFFDHLEIFGLQENSEFVSADGGFGNRSWVFWNTVKEINLQFSKGTMTNEQLALLKNSRLIQSSELDRIEISTTEHLESSAEGIITLSKDFADLLFVYDFNTGEKLQYEILSARSIKINDAFKEVSVYYNYNYNNGYNAFLFDQRLFNGYIYLEGQTKVKDDVSGVIKTGIIRIPKIKITSTLSLMLGRNGNPYVLDFQGRAIPVGPRGQSHVIEFLVLNDDINSDI